MASGSEAVVIYRDGAIALWTSFAPSDEMAPTHAAFSLKIGNGLQSIRV